MADRDLLSHAKDIVFPAPMNCMTPKYIQGNAKKVVKMMEDHENEPDLAAIREEELFESLKRLENISISIRSELESRYQKIPLILPDQDISAYKDLPVKIEINEDSLRVFTPYTFSRGMKESLQLAHYVRAAIKEYEKRHGSLYGYLKPPLYAIVKRNVSRFKGLERDNDNVETHDILNKVFESLGITDNPSQVVFYGSCAKVVSSKSEIGMEFMIFEASSLRKHLSAFP